MVNWFTQQWQHTELVFANISIIAAKGYIFNTLSVDRKIQKFWVLDRHLHSTRVLRGSSIFCVCENECAHSALAPPSWVTRWWLRIEGPWTSCSSCLGHLVRIIFWHQLNERWTTTEAEPYILALSLSFQITSLLYLVRYFRNVFTLMGEDKNKEYLAGNKFEKADRRKTSFLFLFFFLF